MTNVARRARSSSDVLLSELTASVLDTFPVPHESLGFCTFTVEELGRFSSVGFGEGRELGVAMEMSAFGVEVQVSKVLLAHWKIWWGISRECCCLLRKLGTGLTASQPCRRDPLKAKGLVTAPSASQLGHETTCAELPIPIDNVVVGPNYSVDVAKRQTDMNRIGGDMR